MKTTHLLPLLGISPALLILLGGCASEPPSHLVTAPPPMAPTTSVANQPGQQVVVSPSGQVIGTVAAPGQPTSYVVVQAPPAPQAAEAIPPRPTAQHSWIPGYWTWQGNRYAWMGGHWEMPPYAGAKWNNPRWEPENGAVRFYEGYWN